MTIEIHHIKPGPEHEGHRFREHGLSWEDRRDWYEHIATLEAPANVHSVEGALDFAYDQTQHGDRKVWTAAPTVRWIRPGVSAHAIPEETEVRSSSIGDVFVVRYLGQSSDEGTPYQVDFAGFSNINRPIRRDRKASPGGKTPFYGMTDGAWAEKRDASDEVGSDEVGSEHMEEDAQEYSAHDLSVLDSMEKPKSRSDEHVVRAPDEDEKEDSA